MKIYLFKNWNSQTRPIKIRSTDFNGALLIASAFLSEAVYVGERPE